MSKPTRVELDDFLSDLVNWDKFALRLPRITQPIIDSIKRDDPDVDSRKRALFDKWLRTDAKASWDAVVNALKDIDENNLAQQILQRLQGRVIPNVLCRPPIQQLAENLADLRHWELFAALLPGICPEDIKSIKDECSDIEKQKLHLFKKWLLTDLNLSWEMVIQALQKAGEYNLAQKISNDLSHEVKIERDIILELSELSNKFCSLAYQCQKAILEDEKIKLVDLKLLVRNERAYSLDLSHVEDTYNFLDIVSPHYHFLDSHLLEVIVEEFLNHSPLYSKLQSLVKDTDVFKNSTKISYLQRSLIRFTEISPPNNPATVRVGKLLTKNERSLVKTLLTTILCLEESDIPKFFRIIADPTSFCVDQKHKLTSFPVTQVS